MPLFLLFASACHQEAGGLDDLIGQYPTVEMAEGAAFSWRLLGCYDDAWAHIGRVDSDRVTVVRRGYWDTSRGHNRALWRWEDADQPASSGRE